MKSKPPVFNSFQDLAAHKATESRRARLEAKRKAQVQTVKPTPGPRASTRPRITPKAKPLPELTLKTYRGEPYVEFEWEGIVFHVRRTGDLEAGPTWLHRAVDRSGSGPWHPLPGPRDKCHSTLRLLLQKATGLL